MLSNSKISRYRESKKYKNEYFTQRELKESKYSIEASTDMESSIKEFFGKFDDSLSDSEDILTLDKELDYFQIKRFIITAYNNLVDIDLSVVSKRLYNLRVKLAKTESSFLKLNSNLKLPFDTLFEIIFLSKQREYQKLNSKIRESKRAVSIYKSQTKVMYENLKYRKKTLDSMIDTKSSLYYSKSKEFKNLNRKYVDTMHKASLLQDEISEISNALNNFKSIYRDEFFREFKKISSNYENLMLKLLNRLCYKFDSLMWEEAKKSKHIQAFFQKSNIEGGYNSKTFLNYYLKSIDTSIASREHKELFKLQNYLESIYQKNILIITDKLSEINRMREFIENSNDRFKIEGEITLSKLLREQPFNQYDLIILDYTILNSKNRSELFRKYRLTMKTNFIFIFSKEDYFTIDSGLKLGFLNKERENYLQKPMHLNENLLLQKLNSLI